MKTPDRSTARGVALGPGAHQSAIAATGVAVALLLWLWPIGMGGCMPVGGDVTQFFMGLMEVLAVSLREGRLPVWNDLWGYGFPGIGESQMGVFYPPHLLLYRLLPTEYAYVVSLVAHTLWGGLGGWWAARRFGVSPLAAGVSGFVFSASGFFVIHLPHPWSYTTGSWMPWAWGLAWSLLTSCSPRQAGRLFALSGVLVLQVLPGHFQLGFVAQAGIALMALCHLAGAWFRDRPASPGAPRQGPKARVSRAAMLALGLVMVLPLAAVQLHPTARLAGLASARRDFGYLSGFAATPLHLVSLVAPGLFHRSPLWRPLIWDPFHTSPEEMLAYVGLAPLLLAIVAVRRDYRTDSAVRVLAILAGATLFLSLGPYVPGFRLLIQAPGFSFFRAPARWTLATSLALAILAGKGLDSCGRWPRPARSLTALAAAGAGWVAMVLVVVELGLASGPTAGSPWLTGIFQRAFQARPWSDDPDFPTVLAQARAPASDPRIPAVLERAGIASRLANSRNFLASRWGIYARELSGTAGVMAGIVAAAWLSTLPGVRGRPAFLPAALVLLTIVDLLLLGRFREVSLGPLQPLAEQSPVLARLAQEPRGTRIVDGLRNLAMRVGLEPISAYRTLDLPTLEPIGQLARGPLGSGPLRTKVQKALRAAGVGLRLVDPVEGAIEELLARKQGYPWDGDGDTIEDPVLAGWMFGPNWGAEQGSWASKFRIVRVETEPARAWFVPLTAVASPAMLERWSGEPEPLLDLFDLARPLRLDVTSRGRCEIMVDSQAAGWVLVTQLADPQWRAAWHDEMGLERQADILPAFRRGEHEGGWQRVLLPAPGRGTLRLEYEPLDVKQGAVVSALTWVAWGLGLLGLDLWTRRNP